MRDFLVSQYVESYIAVVYQVVCVSDCLFVLILLVRVDLQPWRRWRVVNSGLAAEEVELHLAHPNSRKKWQSLMNSSDASSAKGAPKLLKFGRFPFSLSFYPTRLFFFDSLSPLCASFIFFLFLSFYFSMNTFPMRDSSFQVWLIDSNPESCVLKWMEGGGERERERKS